MILYDQNFNFLGMSAETLSFLGYENMEDFTAMHSDFAKLFVKKEGYIYNFENFSWIHYVLYSGTANKKAFITKKNEQVVPVDVSIKEIFLNQDFNGITKFYGVKLLHEKFSQLSNYEENRQTSTPQSNISLQNLTGINPKEYQEATQSIENPKTNSQAQIQPTQEKEFKLNLYEESKPEQEKSTQTQENPIEFKLDIPELSQNIDEKEVQTTPVQETTDNNSLDFSLNLLADEPKDQVTNTEQLATLPKDELNIPAQDLPSTHSDEKEESSKNSFLNIFTAKEKKEEKKEKSSFDLASLLKPKKDDSTKEENQEETKAPFAFNLLKDEDSKEQEEQTFQEDLTPPAFENKSEITDMQESFKEEKKEEQNSDFALDIFSLQNNNEQEEVTKEPTLEIKQEKEEETKNSNNDFSLDIFSLQNKQEQEPKNDLQALKQEEINKPEQYQEFHADESLIAQIKEDIAEIDQPTQKNTFSLDNMFAQKDNQQQETPPQIKEENEVQQPIQQETTPSLASLLKPQPTQELTIDELKIEDKETKSLTSDICSDIQHQKPEEEKSFNQTLEDVFSIKEDIQITAKDDNLQILKNESENLFANTQEQVTSKQEESQQTQTLQKNQQNITKEAIKSPNKTDIQNDSKSLEIPTLKGLGLSKEDEFELINEFLDDANENIQMIQAYNAITDFHSSKYNLIKIKSSAEILNLDNVIDITKEMLSAADNENQIDFNNHLESLKNLITAYKDRFATISA